MQLLKQSRGNTTASCAKVPLASFSMRLSKIPHSVAMPVVESQEAALLRGTPRTGQQGLC